MNIKKELSNDMENTLFKKGAELERFFRIFSDIPNLSGEYDGYEYLPSDQTSMYVDLLEKFGKKPDIEEREKLNKILGLPRELTQEEYENGVGAKTKMDEITNNCSPDNSFMFSESYTSTLQHYPSEKDPSKTVDANENSTFTTNLYVVPDDKEDKTTFYFVDTDIDELNFEDPEEGDGYFIKESLRDMITISNTDLDIINQIYYALVKTDINKVNFFDSMDDIKQKIEDNKNAHRSDGEFSLRHFNNAAFLNDVAIESNEYLHWDLGKSRYDTHDKNIYFLNNVSPADILKSLQQFKDFNKETDKSIIEYASKKIVSLDEKINEKIEAAAKDNTNIAKDIISKDDKDEI